MTELLRIRPSSLQRRTRVLKTPTISIVDDDPSVRQATSLLVKSLGLDPYGFASVEEYLGSDRLHDTSCLITDVQMPGLSGTDLQSLLIARGLKTPVIFITAFLDEAARARALSAGAVGFLGKPFDEEKLIDCLRVALGGELDGRFGR